MNMDMNTMATAMLMAKVIGGGGGSSVTVESLSVTSNGTYSAPSGKAYDPVDVDVPNTYSAADEGKVVSSGALVPQTSSAVTANGLVDTTLINSVEVNVSGGGSDAEDGIIMRTISGSYENSRVTEVGSYAFAACENLGEVAFSSVATIGAYAFSACFALSRVSFPTAETIHSCAFWGCGSITTASFPNLSKISAYAFSQTLLLVSLFLMSESVVKLAKSNAFSNSPVGGYSAIAGQYGSIYVPASLLTTYQSATNWTYFSSRFVGVE